MREFPFVDFHNLAKSGDEIFAGQCWQFAESILVGLGTHDLACCLDQAYSRYRLRCHSLERIAADPTDDAYQKSRTRAVCRVLKMMFYVGTRREDLSDAFDALDLGCRLLTIARFENGSVPAPHDAYGWWACTREPVQAQAGVIRMAALYEPTVLDLSDEVQRAVGALIEQKAPARSSAVLTLSQRAALRELRHFHALHRQSRSVAGISTRPIRCSARGSGTGKTWLVRQFAAETNLPLIELGPDSWIVSGATARPYTLEMLAKWIDAQPHGGVILLDEADKAGAEGDSSWSRHVRGEFYQLLDRRLSGVVGWEQRHTERLDQFFIVGAATFQSLYNRKAAVGFRAERTERPNILSDQTSIAPELLLRFNSNLIYLEPPSAEEFSERIGAIHRELNMQIPPNLTELGIQASESGSITRWLEAYVSAVLRNSIRRSGRGSPHGLRARPEPKRFAEKRRRHLITNVRLCGVRD
jgi:hypothetical protein